jgi:hypothetical protein
MSQDTYRFIVSPENVARDLSVVYYSGTPVGVYSAMTQVVNSGPNGTSILTGLSVTDFIKTNCCRCGIL